MRIRTKYGQNSKGRNEMRAFEKWPRNMEEGLLKPFRFLHNNKSSHSIVGINI
jgi:hypothetical protein